jgi:hypothetical protein
MAWSNSKIFMHLIEGALENAAAYNLSTDAIKIALFDNTITPDQTVSAANSSFAAGVWASGEVFDGAEWATAGQALDSVTSTRSSNVYTFDAADETSAGSSATLTTFFGILVYDDTVSDNGICYNYFGGTNTVTDGTLTVIFNASGIFTITA